MSSRILRDLRNASLGLLAVTGLLLLIFGIRLSHLDMPIQSGVGIPVALSNVGMWRISNLGNTEESTPDLYSHVDVPLAVAGVKMITSGTLRSGDLRLNAPFTYEQSDFPLLLDRGNEMIIKIISWFTSNPIVNMNIFYILTFFLNYLAFLFGVYLWRGRLLLFDALLAVLLSFTPFHFIQGQFFIMNQIGIIISIALILRILSGRKISKVSLVLVSCTIPFFGMYWCFFSIGLVTFAVIGNLHKRKIREDLIRLLMLVSLTTAVMVLVDFYKTLTFWQTHGTIGTLQRTIIQTEAWSFRIIDLLLVPSYANFVPSFLRRDVALNGSLVFGEASGMFSPLGIVVLLLCLAMVVACFNLGFEKTSNYFFQSRLVESTEQYAFLFLGIICTPLIGSMGGIGSILNLFSLSPIKSWERLSVVFQILSCYVIVSIVHLIGRAAPDMLTKLKKNPVVKWRATVLVVLAVSVPVTLFWSIPLDWNRNFTSAQAQQSSDKEFFSKVEEIVGNQMVFTFPVEMYPEGPEVCKSIPYASIFGFIYTKNTRWSGGAIDGRDSDWQAAVNSKPIEDASNRLFDIGFAGMVFDSWGYSPEAYSELKMTLKNASRSELLLSRDSRWLFVRLTDLFNFDGSFKAPGSFKRILRPKEDTALLEASMANLKASYTCPSR